MIKSRNLFLRVRVITEDETRQIKIKDNVYWCQQKMTGFVEWMMQYVSGLGVHSIHVSHAKVKLQFLTTNKSMFISIIVLMAKENL